MTMVIRRLSRKELFLLSREMGLEIPKATKKAVIIEQILEVWVDDDELAEYWAQAQQRKEREFREKPRKKSS